METKESVKKHRHIIIQYNSVVILTYTFLSFAILLLAMATQGASNFFMFSAYMTSWTDPLLYVRIFTHVLGHIDFEHYFSNFLIILLIGPMIEEKYGSKKLLMLMTITAVITGVVNILFFDTALLGASGIVFMLIILSSYANFQKGTIPLTLILVMVTFVGKEIAAGILSDSNVSYLTHVIGGTIGGVLGYIISGEKKPKKTAEKKSAPPVAVAPEVAKEAVKEEAHEATETAKEASKEDGEDSSK